MLVEFLAGEAGGPEDQQSSSQVSRLIIAGNSLAPIVNTVQNPVVVELSDKKSVCRCLQCWYEKEAP